MSKGISGKPSVGGSLMISEGRWAMCAAKQRAANRKVLSGYPILTPFKNIDEVNQYLGSDRITCLLCGKAYKALPSHLAVHEITEKQYKKQYKIPSSMGLLCAPTREKYIATAKKLMETGVIDPQKLGDSVRKKYANGGKRKSCAYVSVLQEANNPKKAERLIKFSRGRKNAN